MILPNSWGAPEWLIPVIVFIVIATLVVAWNYWRSEVSPGWKFLLAMMKVAAATLLGICLLEPQSEFEQVEPGSNIFLVLADNSQSLQIKDRDDSKSRLDRMQDQLSNRTWMRNLEDQFDVRKYIFDSRIQAVPEFNLLDGTGQGSSIISSLRNASRRYEGRPLAGIILLTDGNATDWASRVGSVQTKQGPLTELDELPPVYPVVFGKSAPARDIGITDVSTSQTNFESAPVTITANALTHGFAGSTVIARLVNEQGEELQRQEIQNVKDDSPFAIRFQLKPENRGVNNYQVSLNAKADDTAAKEATDLNNRRSIVVDRGRGPFRVLYVCGRPNWEYKFMRRSLADDHEVELVGMVRLAKKEPKFSFRSHRDESTNPLYRGFGNEEDQTAERYDEPVIIRLDAVEGELRDGFPKDEETMFKYDALIIDDLEAEFFTQDQKSLVQQFVRRRGGGLLMLGGQESFGQGSYDRTAIGEILPVYLDSDGPSQLDQEYFLNLTREGWVQPWVRVNATENAEKKRIKEMPGFQTINASRSIKPGATVLATVETYDNETLPALVVQKFGNGKTAALLVGDFWRWQLQSDPSNDDLSKAWRQMVRWLVSETPRRVEVNTRLRDESGQRVDFEIKIHDETYRPYDNAEINLSVITPDKKTISITPEASADEAGIYNASFVTITPGPYKIRAEVNDSDGSPIETRESGWVSEPNATEFEKLTPNVELMNRLAKETGGEVVAFGQLGGFVSGLKNRKVPIMTKRVEPWWHQWSIFSLALGLLVFEWGLRRIKGLS